MSKLIHTWFACALEGSKIVILDGHVGFAHLLNDYSYQTGVLNASDAKTIAEQIRQNNYKSAWAVFSARLRSKLIRMLSDN
jgi:hypothetical protein